MADIRESDKGYETRVFSITSKTIGKTQICIGKKYDENGRDRYNVYRVVNDTVGGILGYYEVDSGTKVTDATSEDFDVARFGEPHFMKTGKSKEYVEEEEPPPQVKSTGNFKNIDTTSTTSGNCFYETVTCAMAGFPYKTTEEEVSRLRKKLGEYITRDDDVIDRYNAFYKEDMYANYYDEQLNGMSMEDIEEDIIKVRKQKNIPVSKLNIEDFKKYQPTPDVDGVLATELQDYFDGQKNLKGAEIKKMFLKKLNTPGVYANEYIVTKYQQMENTKMLFMDHSMLKYERDQVDDHNFKLAKWTISDEFKIKEDTKIILSDYTDMLHFSLLVQIKPQISVFTHSTLPGEVRKLVDNIETILQGYRNQNVGKTGKPKAKAADKPKAKAADKSKAKSDSDSDSGSDSESGKEKLKPKKVDTDESKAKSKPKVVPEKKAELPIPEKINSDSGYTKENLNKMKVPELKELLKDDKYKNVPKSGLKREDMIDCLVNPDQDKCKTKRSKKGGERFTRRK